jgi:magnesium chelatase family protein
MATADEPVTVATVTYTADQACHFGRVRAYAGQPHRGVWLSGPFSAPETRDRMRAAILNSGFRWPEGDGITIRVDTPCHTPDTGIDLAAAVAVLAASGQLPAEHHDLAGVVFLGQLGLDGAIEPPGWLGDRLAFAAKARLRCVVAAPPAARAAPEQVRVWEAANLRLLVDRLAGHTRLVGEPYLDPTPSLDLAHLPARYTPAVRALEVAAAGGHHLAIATPATWEADMLGQLLAGLLPDLDAATTRRLARLYPDAGLLPRYRPHRPPWQPITFQVTVAELVGTPRRGPGLASLAHGGVMLVDELLATADGVADVLCHLLDRQQATITSGRLTVTYPARFQLVLGLHLSDDRDRRVCACPPELHSDVAGGRPKLRRLADRIDIQLPLPTTPLGTTGPATAEPFDVVAARIAQARQAAHQRWSGEGWDTNSRAAPTALARLMPPPEATLGRVDYALQVGTISPRALVAIRRLAVTIADLAGRGTVTSADVAEAYRLRTGRDLP